MEAYDLARKLAFTGARCPVPFTTGPEYTNSVPGVPVLSMLRIFVEPKNWSDENVKVVAREVARVLGPMEQFDVGITLTDTIYGPGRPAAGDTARVMKLDRSSPRVVLQISGGEADEAFEAWFPRLQWEPLGEDFWRSAYAPGAVKLTSQQ
jgi:hypothetical protein